MDTKNSLTFHHVITFSSRFAFSFFPHDICLLLDYGWIWMKEKILKLFIMAFASSNLKFYIHSISRRRRRTFQWAWNRYLISLENLFLFPSNLPPNLFFPPFFSFNFTFLFVPFQQLKVIFNLPWKYLFVCALRTWNFSSSIFRKKVSSKR